MTTRPSTPTAYRLSRIATVGLAAAAILLSGAAGCSSSKKHRAGSIEARAAGFKPQHGNYSRIGYRLDWIGYPNVAADAELQFFDLAGDTIITQDSVSTLCIMDTTSGVNRWSDQLANPLTRFIGNVRDDQTIISCSESEAFYLNIQSGAIAARHSLARVGNTRPAQTADAIIFGCASGEIFGQLKSGGFRIWSNQAEGGVEQPPTAVGPYLAFGGNNGMIVVLDPASGTSISRTRLFGGPGAPMAASENTLFVASIDQSLYAIDAFEGTQLWRHRTDAPLRQAPTYYDNVVYCTLPHQGLTAFAAAGEGGHAKELWSAPTVSGTVVGVIKGRLFTWNGQEACLIDRSNGDVVDRATIDGLKFMRMEPFVDGNMYCSTTDAVVFKLSPRR